MIQLSNGGELGKFEFDEKTVKVPSWFQDCPRAWVNGVTSYEPNKYRKIDIPWKTEEFAIKN